MSPGRARSRQVTRVAVSYTSAYCRSCCSVEIFCPVPLSAVSNCKIMLTLGVGCACERTRCGADAEGELTHELGHLRAGRSGGKFPPSLIFRTILGRVPSG